MLNERGAKQGFTLIELMTALTLAVVVGMAVYFLYSASISAYTAAEKELRFLGAFRTATDIMEREVNSMCWKAGYLPVTAGGVFKPVDNGMFRVHLHPHCAAFYTSLDGVHVHRVAYYFNPPEPAVLRGNNEDDDDDDPELAGGGFPDVLDPSGPMYAGPDPRGGLFLLVDDKGCFVRRKWLDSVLRYDFYSDDYSDLIPHFGEPWDTGSTRPDSVDYGDVMGEGFTEVRFHYVYSKPGDRVLYYSPAWPAEEGDPAHDDSGDDTGLQWGGKGLSYLTVPLGIQIDFHYELEGADRVLSKLMLIYSSKWHELSVRASGG